IAFPLIATFMRATLVRSPVVDHMVQSVAPPGGALPALALQVALLAGAAHDALLLTDCFVQAGQERAVIAQLDGADALNGSPGELLFVVPQVALQLHQFRFALREPPLASREGLRQPPFGVGEQALDGSDALRAGHLSLAPCDGPAGFGSGGKTWASASRLDG